MLKFIKSGFCWGVVSSVAAAFDGGDGGDGGDDEMVNRMQEDK